MQFAKIDLNFEINSRETASSSNTIVSAYWIYVFRRQIST